MSEQKKDGEDLNPLHPNYCIYCGAPVVDVKATFCIVCGKSLGPAYQEPIINFRNRSSIIRRATQVPEDLETVTYPAYVSFFMPFISFLFLTVVTLVAAIIFLLVSPTVTLEFLYSPEFLLIGLFLELFFILPPFLYLRKYFPPRSTQYRFQVMGLPLGRDKAKGRWLEVLIGLGLGFSMVFLVTGIQIFSETLWGAILGPDFVAYGVNSFGESEMGVVPVNPGQLALIWVAMFGAVGIGEETLYRGFTQRGLVKSWGKGAGILITALLFTFAHVLPGLVSIETFVVFFLPYFVLSLLFGFVREWREGNILACIIAHGFYNSLILTFAFLGI